MNNDVKAGRGGAMWTSYNTYNVCYDSHTHTRPGDSLPGSPEGQLPVREAEEFPEEGQSVGEEDDGSSQRSKWGP